MKAKEMLPLVAYDVIKGSSDGTVLKGDVIWISENRMLNSGKEGAFIMVDEWDQHETNDFEVVESSEYCVVKLSKAEGLRKKRDMSYFEYKEKWDELTERLCKAEQELKGIIAKTESETEQKRLTAKLSGLKIALEYIRELK